MDVQKRLNPYEVQQKEIAESRESDRQWHAEVRERARQIAANLEAQAAQDERQQATETEAAFRADEREKYIRAGGSEIQFNQDWPRLRQQIIEQRYLSGEAAPLSGTMAATKQKLDFLYKR